MVEKPVKTPKTPVKKKKDILGIIIVAILIIIAAMYIIGKNPELQESLGLTEKPAIPTPPSPANVELYRFSDLKGNKTLGVELWLLNTGENTSHNITVFIRIRNQNGTMLLTTYITPTTLILRANETTSAYYTISTKNCTLILSTLEITWDGEMGGRNTYTKTTII